MTSRRFRRWQALLFIIGVSACTLTNDADHPTEVVTATIPALPTETIFTPASPPATPTSTPLVTFTGPYGNTTALLDGVCFEFLATLGGQTWAWTTPDDLAAFYDRADVSEACAAPVTRGTFDFTGQALVGVMSTAIGCDAAYRFIDMTQDDTARTQTITLQFEIQTGCPYELVEPLLMAVLQPPAGYILAVVVTSP